MSVRELINAIESGDSQLIQSTFESVISAKVANKLDEMRPVVAKSLFKESTEELDEDVEIIDEIQNLNEEQIDAIITEELTKSSKVGEWINDFVNSDNPKFDGKSKEQRKKMALAAYYAKQQNECVEIEEAMDPKQRSDFNRLQYGAITKDEYDNKWKKNKPKKNKLAGPGGLYKNLVK